MRTNPRAKQSRRSARKHRCASATLRVVTADARSLLTIFHSGERVSRVPRFRAIASRPRQTSGGGSPRLSTDAAVGRDSSVAVHACCAAPLNMFVTNESDTRHRHHPTASWKTWRWASSPMHSTASTACVRRTRSVAPCEDESTSSCGGASLTKRTHTRCFAVAAWRAA